MNNDRGPSPWRRSHRYRALLAWTGVPDTEHWRPAAACQAADPELFFPVSSAGPSQEQIAQARAICEGCLVRAECLAFALETGQSHGIWGGTTEEQRRLLRGQRPATSRVPPGHRIVAPDGGTGAAAGVTP